MTLVHIKNYTSPNYTDRPQVNIHYMENFFTVQDFGGTCTCPEKQSCPEIFLCIEYTLYIQDFNDLRLPWKQSFPWNFCCDEYIFYHSGFLSNFALALKIFTVLNTFFTFRSFEQLALDLKKKRCIEFTVLKMYFYHQDFWVTCACHEKQNMPWNFLLYWNIFFHSGFLSNLRLPWSAGRVRSGSVRVRAKFFKLLRVQGRFKFCGCGHEISIRVGL